MKRAIAVIMLAGASTFAHAQWTGQAHTVDEYTWGTPVPQKHKRPRPAYVNPRPAGPVVGLAGGGVALDLGTGQVYPRVGPDVIGDLKVVKN